MIITTYPNANKFLAKTQAALEKNEAVNNLILGLSLRLSHFLPAAQHSPYFATITENDELLLAAMMSLPRSLVLYTELADWREALGLLLQKLAAQRWPIPGVTGSPLLSEAFAAAWARLTQTNYRVRMRNRLYELRQVNPTPSISGRLRLATVADLDLITEWTFAFQNEALSRGDLAESREVARYKINDQDLYIWEDGQPVCMAGQSQPGLYAPGVAWARLCHCLRCRVKPIAPGLRPKVLRFVHRSGQSHFQPYLPDHRLQPCL
jgi:uncharacterized protein